MLRARIPLVLIAAAIACATARLQAEENKEQAAVLQALRAHFETNTPEVIRYKKISNYGETISGTAPTKEVVAREVELFQQALKAGMLKEPSEEVLWLGQNLVVHNPQMGEAFLKALHEAGDCKSPGLGDALYVASIALGAAGERLAVAELDSANLERRKFWAHYLEMFALYPESCDPILKCFKKEGDDGIKVSLLRSLIKVATPKSLGIVKSEIESAKNDASQAAAIFVFVEMAGFDGIAYLETMKPAGPNAEKEKSEGLEFLKRETNEKKKYPFSMQNDDEFAERFADLNGSAIIKWLGKEGYLDEKKEPPALSPGKKKELLALLADSKGFGLEAVKAQLYAAVEKEDEPALLQIRAVGFFSPNKFAVSRSRTLEIMLRHLRYEK